MVSLTPKPFHPTPEQELIVKAAEDGTDLVISAGAGSGKTKTLELIARRLNEKQGQYIAYNKAIATDAAGRFPANVACQTAHSVAFRAVGHKYSQRLNAPRQNGRIVADLLGLTRPVQLTTKGSREDDSLPKAMPVGQVGRLVTETVSNFCNSAAPVINPHHCPQVNGLTDSQQEELNREWLLPNAKTMWEDLKLANGKFKFEHDHYLKLWALSHPKINVDFIMLDEAQDANPVIAAVFEEQTHAQRILVGDASQAIYGWRGAIDAMSSWSGHHLQLSQSFRFGPVIAEEANKWLTLLNADLRLTGFDQIPSQKVAPNSMMRPDAILCRTNAGAVMEAMSAIEEGLHPAIVGGADPLKRLAIAADNLRAGRGTEHPDLFLFRDWDEVKEYVKEDAQAGNLRVLVKMVDDIGTPAIIEMVDRCVDEKDANIVISTAHKSKGREWDKVRVAADFPRPEKDKPLSRGEMMLNYVTVTRAKLVLDPGGLAWVDNMDLTGTMEVEA